MDEATPQADLRRLLTMLWRRRAIIVATTVVVVVVAVVLSLLADPVFEARTEVLVQPDVMQNDPEMLGRVVFNVQELQTQIRIATSETVLRQATDRLGLGPEAAEGVSAALLPDTRVLVITARDGDAQRAADLAQAVAEEYLRFRREEAQMALELGGEQLAQRLDRQRAELARLESILEDQEEPDPVMNRERAQLADQVAWLSARYNQVQVLNESGVGGGRILMPAALPTSPVEPNPLRSALFALFIGGGLGVGLALGRDLFDDAVRSTDDAVGVLGRPILGRIPRFDPGAGGIAILKDPESGEAEAFRDLRTNLRFVATDLATVTVTSSVDGEGKTTVATNLAVAASLAGFEVLLVDADLRRPSVHEVLGVANGLGLADALAETVDVEDLLVHFDDPTLAVLTAGTRPPNPSELLGSQRLADILDQLRKRFELIVIDSPPALAASDAQEVASLSEATLLVVEVGATGKRALRDAHERMERAGARVSGCVLNLMDPHAVEYGYYQRTE